MHCSGKGYVPPGQPPPGEGRGAPHGLSPTPRRGGPRTQAAAASREGCRERP